MRKKYAVVGGVVLTALVVLTAACLFVFVWRDAGRTETATVTAAGGRIGPGGDLGQLDVSDGAVSTATRVTFSTKGKTPANTLGSVAEPIGKPVSITPERDLPGARVRLALDPGDLPSGKGRQATTANAFIAVYNTTLAMWVPLETTYDARTHQLVATAPHFSLFGRFSVSPLASVWTKAISGLKAFGQTAAATITGSGSALAAMFNGEQKDVSCPGKQADWVVTSDVPAVSGSGGDKTSCVEPTAGGASLRLRSTLRVPFEVVLAPGVTAPRSDYDGDLNDLASLLGHGMAHSLGEGYLPPLGRTELHLSAADAAPNTKVTVHLQASYLPLAVGVILGLLAIIPSEATFTRTLATSAEFRTKVLELSEESLSETTFVQRFLVLVKQSATVKQKDDHNLDTAELAAGALECGLTRADAGTETSGENKSGKVTDVESLAETAVSVAKKCFSSALEVYERSSGLKVSELIQLVNGIPDAWQALRATVDATALAVKHPTGGFDVTAEHGAESRTTGSGTTDEPAIPADTLPLPRSGENVFQALPDGAPAAAGSYGSAYLSKLLPCSGSALSASAVDLNTAWAGAYSLGSTQAQVVSVLYKIADEGVVDSYLDALPASCQAHGHTYTRSSVAYGTHGGNWPSDDGSHDATGFTLVAGGGYLMFVQDNFVAAADQQVRDGALTYLLRKADAVLGLGTALETAAEPQRPGRPSAASAGPARRGGHMPIRCRSGANHDRHEGIAGRRQREDSASAERPVTDSETRPMADRARSAVIADVAGGPADSLISG